MVGFVDIDGKFFGCQWGASWISLGGFLDIDGGVLDKDGSFFWM